MQINPIYVKITVGNGTYTNFLLIAFFNCKIEFYTPCREETLVLPSIAMQLKEYI